MREAVKGFSGLAAHRDQRLKLGEARRLSTRQAIVSLGNGVAGSQFVTQRCGDVDIDSEYAHIQAHRENEGFERLARQSPRHDAGHAFQVVIPARGSDAGQVRNDEVDGVAVAGPVAEVVILRQKIGQLHVNESLVHMQKRRIVEIVMVEPVGGLYLFTQGGG